MELYIIENYKERYPELNGRCLTDKLITDCLSEYGIESPEILRSAKGKPYIELCTGHPAETGKCRQIHFSVSHSGSYFLCIVSDVPVGIDVQEMRNVKADKISERYFTDKEKAYINENGNDGFFRIWTRKEAYGKLTGEGIAQLIKGVGVLDRDDVEFIDFQLEEGIWCSYCVSR